MQRLKVHITGVYLLIMGVASVHIFRICNGHAYPVLQYNLEFHRNKEILLLSTLIELISIIQEQSNDVDKENYMENSN